MPNENDEQVVTEQAADGLDWARALAQKGAWILHVPTQVVGQVFALHEGDPEVRFPTLEVVPGHRFVCTEDNFIPLDQKSSHFYTAMQTGISEVIRVVSNAGSKSGLPMPTAVLLITSCLRSQANMVEAQLPKESTPL